MRLSGTAEIAYATFLGDNRAGFFAVSRNGAFFGASFCEPGTACTFLDSLSAIEACMLAGADSCVLHASKDASLPENQVATAGATDQLLATAEQPATSAQEGTAPGAAPGTLRRPGELLAFPPRGGSTQTQPPETTPRPADPASPESAIATATAPASDAPTDPTIDGTELAQGLDRTQPDARVRALLPLPDGPAVAPQVALRPPMPTGGEIGLTGPIAARHARFMASRRAGYFAVSGDGAHAGEAQCTDPAACGMSQARAAINACLAEGGSLCTIFARKSFSPRSIAGGTDIAAVTPSPDAAPTATRADSRPGPTLPALTPLAPAAAPGDQETTAVAQLDRPELTVPADIAPIAVPSPAAPGSRVRPSRTQPPTPGPSPARPSPARPSGPPPAVDPQIAAVPPARDPPPPAAPAPERRLLFVRWQGIADRIVGNGDVDAETGVGWMRFTAPNGSCEGRLLGGSGSEGFVAGTWRMSCADGSSAQGRYLAYNQGRIVTGTGVDDDAQRVAFQLQLREPTSSGAVADQEKQRR